MSAKTLEAIWHNVPGITPTMRLVLVYLAHRQRDGRCFPSIDTISKDTGLDRRTVQRNINKLCESGWISRIPRKTNAGDGWSYLFSDRILGRDIESPSGGGLGNTNTCHPEQGKAAAAPSIGGTRPPDNNDKRIIVCDTAKKPHTQFGIYDVGNAVRKLSGGRDAVPRSFIEERACFLSENDGKDDKGTSIPASGFIAHCRKWWTCERDKERYRSTAPTAKSHNSIPLAKPGKSYNYDFCAVCGCIFCIEGRACKNRFVPPTERGSSDLTTCRPNDKLPNGTYRSGCFQPRA